MEHTALVVQLIAERFSLFAEVGGPLSAGEVWFDTGLESLYLTETCAWLFLGNDYNYHTLTGHR